MQSFVMQIMVVAFVLASYESLKLLSDYRELENNILVNKPTSRYLSDSGRIIAMSTLKPNLPKQINQKGLKIDPKRLKILFIYKKMIFWSKIFAEQGVTPFPYFAFLLSVSFFCDMFFAACIKYKDSVLCRQPDKNVTFATMVHKYPEKSGGRKRPSPQGIIYHLQTNIEVFNLRLC